MPKQMVTNVIGEFIETGKKVGQQLGQLPGEVAEDVVQQTGARPTSGEQTKGAEEIQKMVSEDDKARGKEIGELKKNLAREYFQKQSVAFQPPKAAPTPVGVRLEKAKQEELSSLEEKKKKELPAPVLAAKRGGKMGSHEYGKGPTG